MFGDSRTRANVKMPTTAELLQSWALPVMARALRQEESDNAARTMFEAMKGIAEIGKRAK